MNNTFNMKRFGWYFKKHTLEHLRTYLLSLTVVVGIVFLGLAIPAFSNRNGVGQGTQYAVYLFVIWLGGSIFTSTIFADLGDRKKAILQLALPVSNLEKFLTAWLFTFPIFLIVATCAFYAVDAVILSLNHPTQGSNKLLNLFDNETPVKQVFIVFLVFHMFSFWGAIYFNKLHFIKTGFTFFLGTLMLSLFNYIFLSIISSGALNNQAVFFQPNILVENKLYALNLNENLFTVNWIVFAICIILLWLSAFYKLKEKQV